MLDRLRVFHLAHIFPNPNPFQLPKPRWRPKTSTCSLYCRLRFLLENILFPRAAISSIQCPVVSSDDSNMVVMRDRIGIATLLSSNVQHFFQNYTIRLIFHFEVFFIYRSSGVFNAILRNPISKPEFNRYRKLSFI